MMCNSSRRSLPGLHSTKYLLTGPVMQYTIFKDQDCYLKQIFMRFKPPEHSRFFPGGHLISFSFGNLITCKAYRVVNNKGEKAKKSSMQKVYKQYIYK